MLAAATLFLAGASLLSTASAADHGTPTITRHVARQAAAATTSPLPLTEYTYAYNEIPYQVNPYPVLRGPQSGFNQCNETTKGETSECQTVLVNSISDFCLWGATEPNSLMGDIEAATVAFCTTDAHGSRTIAPGSLTGVQFMRTSAYIQITGRFDQTGINLDPADSGGELDPHGADLLGNPLGGLVYSTGLPSFQNSTLPIQAIEWNNFIGGGVFCIKLCDPNHTGPNYCENRFDLLGCSYNMPAAYVDGEFTSCEGELQDVVGALTYSQPSIVTAPLPYTPRIPASSNCVTYQSSDLYPGVPTTAATTATATGATTTGTGAAASSRTGSVTSAGAAATSTSTGSAGSFGASIGAVLAAGMGAWIMA